MTHVWEAAISAAAAACSVAVLVHGDAADLNQVAHNAASSSMATQTTVNRDTARDDIDDKDKAFLEDFKPDRVSSKGDELSIFILWFRFGLNVRHAWYDSLVSWQDKFRVAID